MPAGFAESDAEEAALGWLESLGYTVRHGPDIAFGVDGGERSDPGYHDTILQNRLHRALTRLNPGLPTAAVFDAYRKLLRVEAPNLLARNRALHRMLVDGVNVEYTRADGSIAGAQAQVIDFERPDHNDWLAVNQFTVVEGQQSRRADIVIFVNGLPLGVIELKNPADENATIWDAVQQLENYQSHIPALFTYNAALIASDGVQARIGALGAGKEWFKPWRTISGREDAAPGLPELQVVLAGAFQPRRFLDVVRHFIVFEDLGGGSLAKKIAGYHQFHAGQCRGRGDIARRQSRARGRRGGRNLFRPPQPRRRARRQAGRRRLAYARLGQESDDGVLCRAADPASGDGKPHHRRDHRPQRPR
jgi:type I restriction enzyme R subunit